MSSSRKLVFFLLRIDYIPPTVDYIQHSVLITKAMLDLVSSMMLASSLGIGVLLSSVAVFVIQSCSAGQAYLAGYERRSYQ